MIFRWGGPDFNSTYLHSLFNEFVCKLGFVWHEWAYECQKKAQFTHERVEYKVVFFDKPIKGSKSLKMCKLA
jgi:hypothetical protein